MTTRVLRPASVRVALALAALLALDAAPASATTWGPETVTCPVCGTSNEFQAPRSSGSYIYGWPSKYELVFWPLTDPNVLYSCRKCSYSAFMGDFEDLPKEKVEEARKALAGVKLERGDDYASIPMSVRLDVAEKVYRLLGKDAEFWCRYERVRGYHCAEEHLEKEAAAARGRALRLAEELLAGGADKGHARELLIVTAGMRHLLGDDPGAIADLEKASGLTFTDPELDEEQLANVNAYQAELIEDALRKYAGKAGK